MLCVLVPAAAWSQTRELFTPEEQAWIATHPVVKYAGYPDWHPFEYIDNGKVSGVAIEYLAAISRASGLEFQPVLEIDPSQKHQAQRALDHGEVDLLPAVASENFTKTSADPHALLSDPYFVGTAVIITRESSPPIFDLGKLRGKRVAVRSQGFLRQLLSERFPDIVLVPHANAEEVLEAVAQGNADAAIDIDAALMPLWRRKYLNALHISGTVDDTLLSIRMSIRSDMPELVSIINKSMASLTAKETDDMLAKWMVDTDYGAPSWRVLLRFHILETLGALALLAVIITLLLIARRDRRRALRSERDKAAFLAVMSHEIRLPLGAVLSSVELLRETRLDEKQQQIVDNATTAAEALHQLLDNVLDLSKLEVNGMKLEWLPFELEKLGHDVIEIVRHKAQAKHLQLVFRPHVPAGTIVIADPTRLRQVMINLLSNAVKFTEHGSVTLEMTLHQSEGVDMPAQLAVEVRDTGIGISAERRNRLFRAYTQADNTIARRYGGTGLGLNICRQLVELMGGTIELESEVNIGTSVSFTIPVTLGTEAERPKPGDSSQPSATYPTELPRRRLSSSLHASILLVEDHPANRFVIEQQLQAIDCNVVSCSDGSSALRMHHAKPFDMILMDCDLPDMDGYTLTRMIRERERTSRHRTPILALSASTDANHRMRCIECGMDGVLKKPLQLPLLRSELALWCDIELPPDPPAKMGENQRKDNCA
jgi:two-component system sensor histidine kinase EvgS